MKVLHSSRLPAPAQTRRAVLAWGLLCIPAMGWTQDKARRAKAPPAAAAGLSARRWWVELRWVSDAPQSQAQAAHYRSEAPPAPVLMQVQVAEGERARFVLEREEPWVWTEAAWGAAPTTAAVIDMRPTDTDEVPAAPVAAAPAAAASTPAGVMQSLQWRRYAQVLECELLPAQAGARDGEVGVRLRVLWSEPGADAGAVQPDRPAGSERMALETALKLAAQQWVPLARTQAPDAAPETGQEAVPRGWHYRAGAAPVPVARVLQLRVRRADLQ